MLAHLPRLGRWLAEVKGGLAACALPDLARTLAWASKKGWRLKARIAGSAWGSDILVTPQQGWAYHWLTRQVLGACSVCTSDSQHMTARCANSAPAR